MPGAPFPTDDDTLRVIGELRAHTAATALCDATPERTRLVHDPRDGALILALDPRLARCDELVVCLPDDSFETRARLLVAHAELPEHDLGADVYLAYHAEAPSGTVLRCTIDAVKLDDGRVIDGPEVMVANPLWAHAPRLCSMLNADRHRLRAALERSAGVDVEHPVGVGVDPLGLDVRARFGVVRVAFDEVVVDADSAAGAIDAFLRGGPA